MATAAATVSFVAIQAASVSTAALIVLAIFYGGGHMPDASIDEDIAEQGADGTLTEE